MKRGLTELVFILDRSGSMGGLERDTIDGFNTMIKKQRASEGEAVVTTVLFDDQFELLHDRIPLKEIQPIGRKEYFVRGCTALLDAIGRTINKITEEYRKLSDDCKAEKVIFVITTDGLENSSREFSYKRVRELVENQKKQGWEFIFLGANMDAVSEAAKFGIEEDRAVTYQNDSIGIELNYSAISKFITKSRKSAYIGREWKHELEEDMNRSY